MSMFDETPQYQQPAYNPLTDPTRKKQRNLIFAIGGIILLIIIVLIVGAVRSSSSPSDDYVKLAAQHNELLRIVQEHENKARSLDTINYMARAEALLVSSKSDWTEFLGSRYGTSVSSEQQALATNNAIDDSLESASIANRFDDNFLEEYIKEVNEAEQLASKLLETAVSDSNKEILNLSLSIYQSL